MKYSIHLHKLREHLLIGTFISFFSPILYSANIDISDSHHRVLSITPSKESGLDAIYAVYNINDAILKIDSSSPEKVNVSVFSNLGANHATIINPDNSEGNTLLYKNLLPDSGYIIDDGTKQHYIWVVDYSLHKFHIDSIVLSPDNTCDQTILDVTGTAGSINYYSINGRQLSLSRDINLSYNNLDFNQDDHRFIEVGIKKNLGSINEKISLSPPILSPTIFKIEGDRFLKFWNEEETVESEYYSPIATVSYTYANQVNDEDNTNDSSNIIGGTSEDLGGSAPVEISFTSVVSDAVVHYEWQMANDSEFNDITYRINQEDLTYTFTSEGTTYIRFIGSNSDGTCESIGDTYTVTIGTSELQIPNAFSPNGDGVNDEWKVAYRSLIEFKCWIFDRQGYEIFYFDNPSQGWDGRKNGRYVSPGVYYYVIQAEGADGKKYKRSGDINILKSTLQTSSSQN